MTDQCLRPDTIGLRPLQVGDCLDQLTSMLHRAFSRFGDLGIPCSCVNQTPEVTRQRVARGDCFVAVNGDRIVGTITLYAPDAASDSMHYRKAQVASARQLGVDPHFQGKGVGAALLQRAEQWARRRGFDRLALDTPEPAGHLIDYYQRQGYVIVERLQFSGRSYCSVVFMKSLSNIAPRYRRRLHPQGRRGAPVVAATPSRLPQPQRGSFCPVSNSLDCLAYRSYATSLGDLPPASRTNLK